MISISFFHYQNYLNLFIQQENSIVFYKDRMKKMKAGADLFRAEEQAKDPSRARRGGRSKLDRKSFVDYFFLLQNLAEGKFDAEKYQEISDLVTKHVWPIKTSLAVKPDGGSLSGNDSDTKKKRGLSKKDLKIQEMEEKMKKMEADNLKAQHFMEFMQQQQQQHKRRHSVEFEEVEEIEDDEEEEEKMPKKKAKVAK